MVCEMKTILHMKVAVTKAIHLICCMKYIGWLLCLAPFLASAQSDPAENWQKLLSTTFLSSTEAGFGMELPRPVFPAEVKALAGKEIELTGFIIPFDGLFSPQHLMLSFMPVEICYFCGQSGPETVVEVFLAEPMEYTKEPIRIKGVLQLHTEPLETLIFVLDKAEFLGEYEHKP